MVAPMREELVREGFQQLLTPAQVDPALQRPGVTEALRSQDLRFDHLVTVFAGMEKDATAQAREYFEGAMPTSPQAAIFKDGQLVHLMQRQDFLAHSPEEIAATLTEAYRQTVAAG